MINFANVKFKQTISKCLKSRKSLIIGIVVLTVLYLVYSSSDSWPFPQTINVSNDSKPKHYLKNINYVSLPNLIQRQLLLNSSHVVSITPNDLSNLITKSKTLILKKTNEIFWTEESQSERKKRLEYYCKKYGLKHRIISIWRKSSNNYKGRHKYCSTKNCPILVDQKHKFMLCFVQKIASTSMKKFFSILSDNPLNVSANANITAFHVNANDVLSRISPMYYNSKQNKEYFKTIFVRHPFLRLISAFKDKGEKSRSEEPYFYAQYWDPIMRTVRGDNNVNNNSRPLFKEFVKLLLTSSTYKYDEHWAPIWTRCEPCYVEYDFIGKLETSEQDFKYFTNKFETNQTIWENKNSIHVNNRETRKYLLEITAEEIIALYKIYFLDFKLFGYTIEELFK